MKKVKKSVFLSIFCFIILFFTGCTSGASSLFFASLPEKIVYEVGEKVNLDGLCVKSYNSDGTTSKIMLGENDLPQIDTSLAGEKIVQINKGGLSTTFSIYVANIVVNGKEQLKNAIQNASDGDIIYIKKGEYVPSGATDESLYNIVVNKKITFVGDGANNTIIHGNFLVGAKEESNGYLPLDNFSGVKFINLGFKLNSTVNNRYNEFEGPYGKYDVFGAIKTYNTSDVTIKNCSFEGFSYAINSDNMSGLNLIDNTFRNLKINAVRINNDISNSMLLKNKFMDIGTSSLVMENSKQGNVGALFFSFASAQNKGVIVANNTFVRTGLITQELVYNTNGADELEAQENLLLTSGSYVNNSAIVFLTSTSTNNLNVSGVVFCNNNYGVARKNFAFNTTEDNFVNQTGVIISDA